MAVSRRTFLKGSVAAAVGLILPSWLEHAERFIELEDSPFLEKLPSHQKTLYAAHTEDEFGYELFLGDPLEEPNLDITWQEFIDTYDVGQEEFDWRVDSESVAPALHHKVDKDLIFYHWEYSEYPGRKAFRFLQDTDLGPELGAGNGVGSISFYDGFSPANDAQVVAAPDLLSLSLLQKRLNHVDGTVRLQIINI